MDDEHDAREPFLTLGDVFRVLLRRWWWVAGTTVLAAAVAAYLALTAVPIYRSTTVLAPAGSEALGGLGSALGQLGGLASLAGVNLDSPGIRTEEALAVLRSREFIERFVADKELMPRLFEGLWDSAQRRWKVEGNKQPTPARASRFFERRVISVLHDKKTGLVTLNVDWRDRSEGAAWANELVARVNDEMRARAVADSTAYLRFLEREREVTELVESRDAINRLIEAQIKQRMVASVTQQYVFRVVERALPPDATDIFRPRKMLMVVGGTVVGFLAACIAVLLHAALAGQLLPARRPVARHAAGGSDR